MTQPTVEEWKRATEGLAELLPIYVTLLKEYQSPSP
jgi:hypothetical protein